MTLLSLTEHAPTADPCTSKMYPLSKPAVTVPVLPMSEAWVRTGHNYYTG